MWHKLFPGNRIWEEIQEHTIMSWGNVHQGKHEGGKEAGRRTEKSRETVWSWLKSTPPYIALGYKSHHRVVSIESKGHVLYLCVGHSVTMAYGMWIESSTPDWARQGILQRMEIALGPFKPIVQAVRVAKPSSKGDLVRVLGVST